MLRDYTPATRRVRYQVVTKSSEHRYQQTLFSTLSDEQMHAFGWRLPFILGVVFGIVALVVRSRM